MVTHSQDIRNKFWTIDSVVNIEKAIKNAQTYVSNPFKEQNAEEILSFEIPSVHWEMDNIYANYFKNWKTWELD